MMGREHRIMISSTKRRTFILLGFLLCEKGTDPSWICPSRLVLLLLKLPEQGVEVVSFLEVLGFVEVEVGMLLASAKLAAFLSLGRTLSRL
jgi:hypothetical protein